VELYVDLGILYVVHACRGLVWSAYMHVHVRYLHLGHAFRGRWFAFMRVRVCLHTYICP
jgi:hypothetical protein